MCGKKLRAAVGAHFNVASKQKPIPWAGTRAASTCASAAHSTSRLGRLALPPQLPGRPPVSRLSSSRSSDSWGKAPGLPHWAGRLPVSWLSFR